MDAYIDLAEYVSVHEDGTYTVVRGDIDHFRGQEGEPVPVQGALLIKINAQPHESGQHSFRISAIDAGGKRLTDSDIEGTFDVPKEGGKTTFAIGFEVQTEDPGDYEIGLTVDGNIRTHHSFTVSFHEQPENQDSPRAE